MKIIFTLAIYWWVWLIPLGLCGALRLVLGSINVQ